MQNTLIAMGAILTTWAIVVPTLVGLGLLLRRIYGLTQIRTADVVAAFWVGFAVVLAFGQIWHLFLAADWRAWLVLLPLGTAGIALSGPVLWRWLAEGLKNHGSKERWISVICCVVLLALAVRTAFLSTQPVQVHDTGTYHMQATLWSHAYPAVPGLSNLHSRLGLNSSLFVYAATLSEGLWAGRPHHVLMGPLFLMMLILSFTAAARVYLSQSAHTADLLAATFVGPTISLLHWRNYAASLSPNAAVALLVLAGAWQTMVALTSENRASRSAQYAAFCAGLLLTAACTVKLTIVPFAAATWLLVAWRSMRAGHLLSGTARFKPVAWMLIAVLFLAGPWLVRGVILTGYPLYPMTVAAIDVDWRVPEEQAQIEAEWTKAYSRQSFHRPAQGLQWVGGWAHHIWTRERAGVVIPAMLAVGAGLGVVLLLRRRGWPEPIQAERNALVMVCPVLFGLVVWFVTVPDPRFSVSLFWLLAGLMISAALALMWHRAARAVRVVVLGGVVMLGCAEASLVVKEWPRAGHSTVLEGGVRVESSPGLAPLWSVPLSTYVTPHGLQLNVPTRGNQVWGAPLLSTPHPSPNLRLRNPEDVSAGFMSDGPWAPYGYPILTCRFFEYVEQRLRRLPMRGK